MKLDKKKNLAAKTLGVGRDRVIFNINRLDEIKEAITKQDIRDLFSNGAIAVRDIKGRKAVKRRVSRRRRRRLEAKTDYTSRLALIKSGMPRLVVRRTNRYIVAQVIKTDLAQDSIVVGVISRDLINSGWPENKKGSLKSLPASYLTD